MTDTMASLYSLSDFDCDERTKALDDFYNTWKDNTNVIDKWFSIQATSRLENTLEVVKKLTSHKLFNIKNPNKIYALFSAFASANQVIFNRKD
jgi:aminopeptidase N